jgi:tellurium resistance protein TerZ
LNANLDKLDLVYFKHLTSDDGAIRHCGDEREGDEVGDDEKINLSLALVRPDACFLGFTINSYSGQELDDVSSTGCHIFDTYSNIDLASYKMTGSKELDKKTALIMGILYREPDNEVRTRVRTSVLYFWLLLFYGLVYW